MSLFGKKKAFRKELFQECGEDGKRTDVSREAKTAQDLADEGTPVNLARGGIFNTPPIQPFITFNAAQNEKLISQANAHIIFGQDRPGTDASGAGGSGFQGADTIDLVVGLAAKSHGAAGPCDGMIVNRNFASDAARIYISGLTKVDTNFGIAREDGDAEEYSSAIGMKADKVRVFGSQGVKIITGRAQGVKGSSSTGEVNSKGGAFEQAAYIDLLAGNAMESQTLMLPEAVKRIVRIWMPDYESTNNFLQPAVKGDNLRLALTDLAGVVDRMSAVMLTMNLIQQACVSVCQTNPAFVLFGQTAALGPALAACNIQGAGPSWSQQTQMLAWKNNYLSHSATK